MKNEIVNQPENGSYIDPAKFKEITLDEVADVLSLTIKFDKENKIITFLCMLSAYTNKSQINVSFNAPSSSGKTYMTTEIAKLFPEEDKIELSGASPTSFYHGEGKYDKNRKAKIVSLERKILLMYEQPNPMLQEKLRAVLSHDARELNYRITNKDKKGKNRAELIIIRGFPATVFCSAGLKLDEQEATRAILLSPEVSEEKIKQGVHLQAMRSADENKFDNWLESQQARISLKERINAIKNEQVDEITIPSSGAVENRFADLFARYKPRHMRDIDHLFKLIKSIALLNVWFRRDDSDQVVASQKDIDEAFKLWEAIIESQNLNVPPAVMRFYKVYILGAFYEKKSDPDYNQALDAGLMGVSNQELGAYYLKQEQSMLNDEHLRKQILPQLVNSGMIALEQPIQGDRRSKHIYPKWYPSDENGHSDGNNIGKGGGSVPQEVMDLFFGENGSS